MIAIIHQPHFLPWLGYFNKLANVDHFIILDNVQFRRRYYQNRTKIKTMHGAETWLTIPVHANRSTLIKDVKVADSNWQKEFFKTIELSYTKANYFDTTWPPLKDALLKSSEYLLDINLNTLQVLIDILGYHHLKMDFASNFNASDEPTQRLIDICRSIGATCYLFGEGGGIIYHNTKMLKANGIQVIQQDFKKNHPIYPQLHGNFLNGLSIIDAIFNVGPLKAAELIKESWCYTNNRIS